MSRPIVMVMPYRALVEKAREEGFAVHAVWDARVARGIFGGGADAYLAALRRLAASLELTDFDDPHAFEQALRRSVDHSGAELLYHVGAEESMLATARLAERWGLQVNPARAVELLNDKRAMRRMLAGTGVSPVRFAEVTSVAGVRDVLAGFELPVVVKPTDLSGSRAVYLLHDPAELDGYADLLERYGYRGPLLVEEYLRGDEYSVETVSVQGHHQVVGVTRKVLGPAPLFVEAGHRHPAVEAADAGRVEAIGALAVRLLDLAGYRTGPAHTEVIWTPDGPRIVESQARLGGDRIPRLVELATGVDLEREVFRALRGDTVQRPDRPVAAAGIAYLQLPLGRVTAVRVTDASADLEGLDEVSFPWHVGDVVPATVDWRSRHGYVVARAATAQDLEHLLATASRRLAESVVVEPVAAASVGRS